MFSGSSLRVGAALVCIVLTASCSTEQPAASNLSVMSRAASSVEAEAMKSIDDVFMEIGTQVPGFAGMWFDPGRDAWIVAGTSGTDFREAEARLRQSVGPLFRWRSRPVRDSVVAFPFADLQSWRVKLRSLMGSGDVASLDVDERMNRIDIGTTEDTKAPHVEAFVTSLGIPSNAVVIHKALAVTSQVSLQDHRRSVIENGFQITYKTLTTEFTCTHGADVVGVGPSNGFVTAGHCSATGLGGNGSATLYQHQYNDGIATEWINPGFFSGSPCPSGKVCRFSDAMWAKYGSSSLYSGKKIAETTTIGTTAAGSLTLNLIRSAPYSSNLAVGMTARKTGRTSGTTEGTVAFTCVDLTIGGNGVLLCQDQVSAYSNDGDSGAPVYWVEEPGDGSAQAWHAGISWGRADSAGVHVRFNISPWSGIASDLWVFY